MVETFSEKKLTIAVINGKYKTGAPLLYELIKHPNLTVRIGLGSGKPVHPFFMPLLAAGCVIYSDADYEGMLKGADVVLCYTASAAGLQGQLRMIEKAASLGVKLFVPCEFGLDWEAITSKEGVVGQQPLVKSRSQAIEKCEELGLGYLRVLCGLIPENILVKEQSHPYIPETSSWHWDFAEKKVTILGDGEQPATWTSMAYMASIMSHLLSTQCPESLASLKTLRISGTTATQNEIISAYESATGLKLAVTYVPINTVLKEEKELFESEEGKGVTPGKGVVNYWTEWPQFIQAEIAKGNGLLKGDIKTVKGVSESSWGEIFKVLPVIV